MTDPMERITSGQRRLVVAALFVYLVLFLAQLVTGDPLLAAATDLLLAALVVPVSGYVLVQFWEQGTDSTALVVAVASVFVSGLTIGYAGLASLDVVDEVLAVQAVGNVALLLAIVLYLYWRSQQ